MAKIRARNVDDALFARIEQSAMKNERSLEGEIRGAGQTVSCRDHLSGNPLQPATVAEGMWRASARPV